MNEVIKAIKSRRSIRQYKSEQISDEQLSAILEAGIYAPSACNQQSWKLIVIQNKELMAKAANLAKQALDSDESPFYGAPTVVMLFGDTKAYEPVPDSCLVMQNMTLAAQSLGIGSCIVFCANELFKLPEGEAFKNELKVPENYGIIGSVTLGYPDISPEAPARRADTILIHR